MRRLLPILLLLSLSACTDHDLQKVGKGLAATAQGISVVQTTVIDGNKNGLIDLDTTRTILGVCVRIDQAGKDATAVTRAISKLDQPSRLQVLEILKPVIAALQGALDNGLTGIKDQETLTKVRAALLAVQTTLNSIQLILAGG